MRCPWTAALPGALSSEVLWQSRGVSPTLTSKGTNTGAGGGLLEGRSYLLHCHQSRDWEVTGTL